MQVQESVRVLASMTAPSIPDYANLLSWIKIKQFLKKLRHDKAIFPVIESVMPFSCVQILCHEQIAYPFYFLPVGYMIIPLKNIFSSTIFIYGRFAFLIKR